MRLPFAGAVFAAVVCLSFAASADNFMKECQAGTPGPDSVKICTCMSEKIGGGDRADATEAMSATNAALAKGAQADPSTMTPKVAKSLETVMKVQLQCM